MDKTPEEKHIESINEAIKEFKDYPELQKRELICLCEIVSSYCLMVDKLMDPYNGKNFDAKLEVLERIYLGENPDDIEREKLIQAFDGTDPWDPNICW